MPVSEELDESKVAMEQNSAVELLIGVTGDVDSAEMRSLAAAALKDASLGLRASGKVVLSCPGDEAGKAATASEDQLEVKPYRVVPSSDAGPWAQVSAAQRGILALAAELKPEACVVISAEMAKRGMDAVRALAAPVLGGQCDVAMPIYPVGRYEGLVNTAIVMPLTRALYCKRVQMPLSVDFGASARFAEKVSARKSQGLLWPVVTAAQERMQVGQVHLAIPQQAPMEGV